MLVVWPPAVFLPHTNNFSGGARARRAISQRRNEWMQFTTRNSSPTGLVFFLQSHHGAFRPFCSKIFSISPGYPSCLFPGFSRFSDSLIWPARVPPSHAPHHAALFKCSETSNHPVHSFYTGEGCHSCKGTDFSIFGFVFVKVLRAADQI